MSRKKKINTSLTPKTILLLTLLVALTGYLLSALSSSFAPNSINKLVIDKPSTPNSKVIYEPPVKVTPKKQKPIVPEPKPVTKYEQAIIDCFNSGREWNYGTKTCINAPVVTPTTTGPKAPATLSISCANNNCPTGYKDCTDGDGYCKSAPEAVCKKIGQDPCYTKYADFNLGYTCCAPGYTCAGYNGGCVPKAKPPASKPPTTTTIPSPTPSPLPSPSPSPYGSCHNVLVYDKNWVSRSPTDFATTKAGDQFYLCASGSGSTTFTQARFTVNDITRPIVTFKKPDTAYFCDLYTIPSGVYNYSIGAQVYSPEVGWK